MKKKRKSRIEMRIELEYGGKKFAIENDGLQFIAKELRVSEKGEPYEYILGYC